MLAPIPLLQPTITKFASLQPDFAKKVARRAKLRCLVVSEIPVVAV
jgi:hypothetical protein